jgi:hypothetical protein
MENGKEPVVLWIEANCAQFECSDLKKIPVALERSSIHRGKALNFEIPSYSHGILLSYWRNEASLEIPRKDLRRLFSGLLKFTPFDDLCEFAAVAGEEIREEYGATFEVLALISAWKMRILDHERAANILISFFNAWETGELLEHLDDDTLSIVADQMEELLKENILETIAQPDRELVAGSIAIFLIQENRFDAAKPLLD